MALFRTEFVSVEIVPVKIENRFDTAGPPIIKTTYDIDNARYHALSLGLAGFLFTPKWFSSLFVSVMTAGFFLAVIYGLLRVASVINLLKRPLGPGEQIFLSASCIVILITWIFTTALVVIRSEKKRLVEKDRGTGSWKLIEKKKWDSFVKLYRLREEK